VVRVFVGDPLVHLEEVAVALFDDVTSETADGLGEVEVHAVAERANAHVLVDHLLGRPRRDIAGDEIAEGRVAPLEVVVALVFGDVAGRPGVAAVHRDPDTAVVAQ
jgi:hypothetical protein